jgi:hypothetical protein
MGSELRQSPHVDTLDRIYSPVDDPSWGPVARAGGGLTRYLYLGSKNIPPQPYFPQVTDLKGIRSANGYDPLAPRAYLSAIGLRQDGGSAPAGRRLWQHPGWILDLLRISTVLVPVPERPRHHSPLLVPDGLRAGILRYRFVPRVADAFVVGSTRRSTRAQVLASIRGEGGFDPSKEALLEQDCSICPEDGQPGQAGRVVEERRARNSISLEVEARRSALLVVSESWLPGWHATVDGRSAPVRRADGLIMGVPVAPGVHSVRLRYEAPGARAGLAISGGALLALSAVGIFFARRRRF